MFSVLVTSTAPLNLLQLYCSLNRPPDSIMPRPLAPVARFIKKFRTPSQNWLDLLPNDIIVDCVIIYLNIKEVLRLRRVCNQFWRL